MTRRLWAVIGAIVAAGTPAAQAQGVPRVAVSFEAGRSANTAAPGLETMLRGAGMDDTDPFGGGGLFGGGMEQVSHPYSSSDPAWALELRVRVRPRVSLGFSTSTASTGATRGYYAPDPADFRYVSYFASYSVRSLAAVVNWHPLNRVRVGAGPALHTLEFSVLEGPDGGLEQRKIGWTAEAGFAFIDTKYFFSEVTARYRGMGALALDSMTVEESFSWNEPPLRVTLPAADVTLRHWVVGVGLGFRFGS